MLKLNGESSIAYQYTLPNNYTKKINQSFTWILDQEWSACNKSCGKGYRLKLLRCVNNENEAVNDTLCDLHKKPELIIEPCNTNIPCKSELVILIRFILKFIFFVN